MSNIFLEIDAIILVLQKKQENPTIDMAKIQIKSERLTPFGGYFGSVLKPSCKPILLSTQFHKPI